MFEFFKYWGEIGPITSLGVELNCRLKNILKYIIEVFILIIYKFLPFRGMIIYTFAIELWGFGLNKIYEGSTLPLPENIFFLVQN